MATYDLVATIMRAVTDRISLRVEASNYTEALAKAEQVLEVFPKEHDIDGVPYVYVEHRDNGDAHIMEIRELITDEDD